MVEITRRSLAQAGLSGMAAAGAGLITAAAAPVPETGAVAEGKIALPDLHAATEVNEAVPNPDPMARRLGVAVVGLGHLTLSEILPAISAAKSVRLTALVSGHADKAKIVASQQGLAESQVYSYEDFDHIASDASVDFVYIVLPNSMHADFTVRAAKAGKHVLCEKPMATNVDDCARMIAACAAASRKLMVAYRCQYEPHHRTAIDLVRGGELGALRVIQAINVQNDTPGQWRQQKAMSGGGSLPDVGVYCFNAFRYLTGEEPVEITAQVTRPDGDRRFAEVEDVAQFTLRFPSGVIGTGLSGYSGHETRSLHAVSEKGSVQLDNAFGYGNVSMRIGRKLGEGKFATNAFDQRQLTQPNPFTTELDHFADCIRRDLRPHTPGEEGMQDITIMQAIYQAAASGQTVRLQPHTGRDTTRGPVPG